MNTRPSYTQTRQSIVCVTSCLSSWMPSPLPLSCALTNNHRTTHVDRGAHAHPLKSTATYIPILYLPHWQYLPPTQSSRHLILHHLQPLSFNNNVVQTCSAINHAGSTSSVFPAPLGSIGGDTSNSFGNASPLPRISLTTRSHSRTVTAACAQMPDHRWNTHQAHHLPRQRQRESSSMPTRRQAFPWPAWWGSLVPRRAHP